MVSGGASWSGGLNGAGAVARGRPRRPSRRAEWWPLDRVRGAACRGLVRRPAGRCTAKGHRDVAGAYLASCFPEMIVGRDGALGGGARQRRRGRCGPATFRVRRHEDGWFDGALVIDERTVDGRRAPFRQHRGRPARRGGGRASSRSPTLVRGRAPASARTQPVRDVGIRSATPSARRRSQPVPHRARTRPSGPRSPASQLLARRRSPRAAPAHCACVRRLRTVTLVGRRGLRERQGTCCLYYRGARSRPTASTPTALAAARCRRPSSAPPLRRVARGPSSAAQPPGDPSLRTFGAETSRSAVSAPCPCPGDNARWRWRWRSRKRVGSAEEQPLDVVDERLGPHQAGAAPEARGRTTSTWSCWTAGSVCHQRRHRAGRSPSGRRAPRSRSTSRRSARAGARCWRRFCVSAGLTRPRGRPTPCGRSPDRPRPTTRRCRARRPRSCSPA